MSQAALLTPLLEKEFLDFIFKKSQFKMALIITHRMNSVKQADEIIVLDTRKTYRTGQL
ncbi:hypothetical protein BTM119_10720 [Helicobacter pylori]